MTSHVDTHARSGLITVACLQMLPTFGDVAANVADSLRMIDQAAARGADLVVLPELCNSGYVFASREEAFALAEEIPGGPTVKAWAERAARHRLYLVAGICERAEGNLYNSAVVLGPEGYLGTFRKVHLWNEETLYFEPGDLGFPVFHTPIGRIGVAICYDGWSPKPIASALCKEPTSSACRPIGSPFPARPRDARRWPIFLRWAPRIPIRCSSPAPIA